MDTITKVVHHNFTEEVIVSIVSDLLKSGIYASLALSWKCAKYIVEEYFTVTFEIAGSIHGSSNARNWMSKFIFHQINKSTRHLSVAASLKSWKSEGDDGTANRITDLEQISDNIEALPNKRTIGFWYKSVYVLVNKENEGDPSDRYRSYKEVIKLTAFTRDKNFFINMLSDAQKLFHQKSHNEMQFFSPPAGFWEASWDLLKTSKNSRLINTIILPRNEAEALCDDIIEFTLSETWYLERGIPYRRGYLFHGPPGCGKTSFIKAIARQIGYDICILSLNEKDLTDSTLNRLFCTIPPKTILLLEDIDAAFEKRKKGVETDKNSLEPIANCNNSASTDDKDEAKQKKSDNGEQNNDNEESDKSTVTLSGLLNAIDGVSSGEHYLLFMTTNHIEKLDPALIRPGRIDMRVFLDYPQAEQIERYFRQFYRNVDDNLAIEFAEAVIKLEAKVSMAQVQGLLLRYKNNPSEAVSNIDLLLHDNFVVR